MKLKTEDILNRECWIDGWGTMTNVQYLEEDHTRNILMYLFKNRHRMWLGCRDTSLIERFHSGDDFFQLVIRNSTLWTALIQRLGEPAEGFNFAFRTNR